MVMQEYPKQALWLFTSVVKSTKHNREHRGKAILDQLRVRIPPICPLTHKLTQDHARITLTMLIPKFQS
jgi:hypothetical protein